jgi:molybdopterin synthase sulfur carrier subunit
MQITVRLLADYRQYLPVGRESQGGYMLEVESGAAIRQVLLDLPIPPDGPCTFLVNGRHAVRDQILREGDILSVFPAVGGG